MSAENNEHIGTIDPDFMNVVTQSISKGDYVEELLSCDKLYDRDGKFMYVVNYGGLSLPKYPLDSVEKLKDFPVRDDDVFINAFPSSGTHWFWEMVCMLFRGKAEHVTGTKEQDMLEFLMPEIFEKRKSPRVLNTHLRPKYLPDKLVKEGKVILVVRNPKDVVVSNYRQTYGLKLLGYEGSFSSFFELFMEGNIHYGSWFDYINDWMEAKEKNPNILLLTYEEAKKDLPGVVSRLANYLNLDLNKDLINKIADLGSFNAMKAVKESPVANMNDMWRQGCGFFRSGKAGTWKEWLTVEQHERIEESIRTKLRNSEISKMYLTTP